MTIEVQKVPTRSYLNLTEALRNLAVGETIRFPAGTKYGSIRTLAAVNGIKLRMQVLPSGEIEVTRVARSATSPPRAKKQDKMYDL